MADSTAPPVIAGLGVGLAFIAVFGVIYFQAPLIDKIGVPLDKGKNQQIVDIIQSDSRVIELLRPRDVTLFFIGSTSWYEKCTFGPPVRVIIQTDKGYLFLLVDYANKRVADAVMQVKGEVIPVFSEPPNGAIKKPEEHVVQIVDGIITVNPRESNFIEFTVPECAIDVMITGSFTASGHDDNETRVIFMPPDQYDNWRAGGNFGLYGGSGKSTTETFEMSLGAGAPVYLVFDNTFSNSTKTVDANIQMSYKR